MVGVLKCKILSEDYKSVHSTLKPIGLLLPPQISQKIPNIESSGLETFQSKPIIEYKPLYNN